jgi:hypothetical protein
MTLSTCHDTDWSRVTLFPAPRPDQDQRSRILAALGPECVEPRVSEETLAVYYKHLKANLSLPFTVCYPEPQTAKEATEFECTVVDLIDPSKHLGDEFDGIFCKTRKDKYQLNLPLNEVCVPADSPNRQAIDDYRHWFWNWR